MIPCWKNKTNMKHTIRMIRTTIVITFTQLKTISDYRDKPLNKTSMLLFFFLKIKEILETFMRTTVAVIWMLMNLNLYTTKFG